MVPGKEHRRESAPYSSIVAAGMYYAGHGSQPHDRKVAGSHGLPQLLRSDSLLLRDDHLATVRGTCRSQIRIKKPPTYPC